MHTHRLTQTQIYILTDGRSFQPCTGAHSSVNVRVACLILFKHKDPILRTDYIKGHNCCSELLCVKFNNMIVCPLQY